MIKPADWEAAEAEVGSKFSGGSKRLPLENFIVKIVQATPYTSKEGNESLRIAWDVAEGEYTDFYMNKWKADKESNPNAKWKQCATYYIRMSNTGRLKGLAQCLEASNPNYKWDFDEKKLTGLKFAAQMAGTNEEYNGHKYVDVRIANIFPVSEFDTMPDAFMRKPKEDDIPAFTGGGFGSAVDNGEQIPF